MNVIRCVRSVHSPLRFVWQNLKCWTLHANCKARYFHTCQTYRHQCLVPFYTAFTDLDIAWGSQVGLKAKPVCFIFSHTFHLIRMKFGVVIKQFKLNILRLLMSRIYGNKGYDCCFTNSVKKLKCWYTFRCLWSDLIHTWYDDRYYCTVHFIIV